MAVWLPRWPADLVRRHERPAVDRRPLLVWGAEGQRRVVVSCCERAAEAGVRPGMVLAQARALFHDDRARLERQDEPAQRHALRSLAAWAHRLSPLVALDEPDGLLLDVSGCAPSFGGEAALFDAAERGFAGLRLSACVAIAPTVGCAWAFARFGDDGQRPAIVPPKGERAAIAPLPVAALRLEPRIIEGLAEVGVHRVEQLLSVPRAALPGRFGDEIVLRIDQALGQAMEPIEPVRSVTLPAASRELDGPTDRLEAIELIARDLLDAVADQLRRQERGARSLRLVLDRSDLPPVSVSITLGGPARDPRHLWSLLRPRLERTPLGFGVQALRLEVSSMGPLRHEQLGGLLDAGAPAISGVAGDARELLDTLRNRLGRDRVVCAVPTGSHLPERAFEWVPTQAASRAVAVDPMLVDPADRPTLLLDRPVPLSPDVLDVAGSSDDERIGAEWWRDPGPTRVCRRVTLRSGERLWVVESGGRWALHGLWA